MERSAIKISNIRINFYLFPLLIIFSVISQSAKGQSFKALLPESDALQYAGSIGYLSAGVGYELFKNNRGALEFRYGYVPENMGGELHIVTAKFNYRPFEITIKDWAKVYPANPGVFISYTAGEEWEITWDKDQYVKGYYWWSPAIRPHISLSTEVSLNAKKLLHSSRIKSLSIYSEFNTNELYFVSQVKSGGVLPLGDIIKLGIGVRMNFDWH